MILVYFSIGFALAYGGVGGGKEIRWTFTRETDLTGTRGSVLPMGFVLSMT